MGKSGKPKTEGNAPTAVAPIAKKSAKKKKEDRLIKKALNDLKQIKNECWIKSPVCIGIVQGADHVQKIGRKNATDKRNLKPCCNPCNEYKESHPEWAKANGHHVSRFDKTFLESA